MDPKNTYKIINGLKSKVGDRWCLSHCFKCKNEMKPIKYVYINEGGNNNETMTNDDEYSDDDNNYTNNDNNNNAIVSDDDDIDDDDEMNDYNDEEKIADDDDDDEAEQEDDDVDEDGNDDNDNDNDNPLTIDEFRLLVKEIASTRCDSWTSIRRNQSIQRLLYSLDTNKQQQQLPNNYSDNNYKVLINWKGTCKSIHSFRRIVHIYTSAVLILSTIVQPNVENNESPGINASSTSTNSKTIELCKKLLVLINDSNDVSVVQQCVNQIRQSTTSSTDTVIEQRKVLGSIFQTLVTTEYQQQQSLSYIIPAIVVGATIGSWCITKGKSDTSTTATIAIDDMWVTALVHATVTKFSSIEQLIMCQSVLQRISSEQWKTIINQTLLNKLKSHPDNAIVTICGWYESMSISTSTSTSTTNASIDIPDDEWIQVLFKHLLSGKDNNVPVLASRIIIAWSKQSSDCTNTFSLALIEKAKPTVAVARVIVYQTLQSITTTICCTSDGTVAASDTVIQQVLNGLLQLVKKEPKIEHKTIGIQSIIMWTILAKRSNNSDAVVLSKTYQQVLDDFIYQPIISKKGSTDACTVLSIMLRFIHPDLLESIASDIWECTAVGANANATTAVTVWEKTLETIIDTATTKKAVQVEGLLVLYITLLKCTFTTATTLPSFVTKVLSAGSLKKDNPSFFYSSSMFDIISTNDIASCLLIRIISLYTKLLSTSAFDNKALPLFPSYSGKSTAACRALAIVIASPVSIHTIASQRTSTDQLATHSIIECLKTIVTYQPQGVIGIIMSLFEYINSRAIYCEQLVMNMNITRTARENELNENSTSIIKGKGIDNGSGNHPGYDSDSVRHAVLLLSRSIIGSTTTSVVIARVLILLHTGTSLRHTSRQRSALEKHTRSIIQSCIVSQKLNDTSIESIQKEIANYIVTIASHHMLVNQSSSSSTEESSSSNSNDNILISTSLQKAALSLFTTLGLIASSYHPEDDKVEEDDDDDAMKKKSDSDDQRESEFVSTLCTKHIACLLQEKLVTTLQDVEGLSVNEIDIFMTASGTLVRETNNSKSSSFDPSTNKSGSKRLSEDEEWERQMKKELEEKKKREASGVPDNVAVVLSDEDKKMIAQQDITRQRIAGMLNGDMIRCLDAIDYLCSSDIEIGNKCLPIFSECVLNVAVSNCPAMKRYRPLLPKVMSTLTALATCVYEIDEVYASDIATALVISCRVDSSSSSSTKSSLPSPCPSVAKIISELDDFHDALSGPSFAFLFPIIQASLIGIRTPVGCEGALRVLGFHTSLLVGENYDPIVVSLRKKMIVAVLELLKHDRAMAFHDPTPFETLTDCFQINDSDEEGRLLLSDEELEPLLDERGTLGPTHCRIAALRAIASIATDHNEFIKSNLLVENRVWLNCFELDEAIRNEARSAWCGIHEVPRTAFETNDLSVTPKPSLSYAELLLPLLSHSDASISRSAATALANAMGMHPGSASASVELLCKSYIDSFPCSGVIVGGNGLSVAKGKAAATMVAAPPKKKPLTTGLPKKTSAAPKSVMDIAGIGKPKVAKKRTAINSALLKPKQERTLDQDEIASMFKAAPVGATTSEEKDTPEKITTRAGVIRTIASVADISANVQLDEATLTLLTGFLMAYGLADTNDEVKGAARNALRDVVATKGGSKEAIAFLLPQLESVLKTGLADAASLRNLSKDKVPQDVSASDRRKEGAVVALGSVALHLQGVEYDDKVDSTIDMLLATLKTPSEEVQQSVADALTKLMKKGRTGERIESILSILMKDCLSSDSLAARRGAGYGLAAVVRGGGIALLKKHEIVKQLEEACVSGSANGKEGALFAIELLSNRLGLLFEPYVIVLLPSLLRAFSDSSDHVRTAANETTGLIMSKLSAHGVKLVMPAVLTAFDDPAWRTKQASIRMLGSMSHLAPKQLASALPKVVPKLTEAFSDTHPKVKGAAQEALNEISTVIRNPEVSSISTVLLKALTDPADYTIKALEALIATEFLHSIDAPSLALIVPILHRGLRDRGATTKRFGGLIAGNICTMINDPKDFVPYLSTLLPDIQTALLDPIPDVRSTSAKALGSLTRTLGEQIIPELRPWLVKNLRDEKNSSAERSGAAQGLTEVLIASGSEVVEEAMRDDILPLCNYPESSTREGVLWMLTFLPPALGQGFTPLIDVSLPALIAGLSDDSEPVRDVAFRAGRVLIRSHGKVHVNKILPSLENGLNDVDHRIRIASLALLGDLLSLIGGTQVVRGDGDTQEDIRKAERAQAQIALALGADTRKRVLSSLYLARSDTVHLVRQSAIQVWKTVVSVTARTLRDILSVIVAKIIDDLASGSEERTEVAGRCLGDLVHKLGDSVLPQIVPVLRNSLYDGNEHTKRGVCVGLIEVLSSSTRDQILKYIEIIIKVVQDALCDESSIVRKMAASCFQQLHNVVGNRALDEVVPSLMVALERGDADEHTRVRALNGLTGILSIRSRELLPYIIPRLIAKPITVNHAKALSGVIEVAGGTIHLHFGSIIPALLSELADPGLTDELRKEAITQCTKTLCGSVDEIGINVLISEIAAKCSSDKAPIRTACCKVFDYIASNRAEKQDYFEQIPIILRELVYRLNDDNVAVLVATNQAFTSLSKFVPAQELVKHVEFMRNILGSMVSESRRRKGGVGDGEFLLPGFNIPKGVEPLIPIFQQGILYGSPIIREVSAMGLGDVLGYTAPKYLAGPLIVKMTGPLLRVVGDRNPSNVKIAILKTLGLVLVKGGPALRAFVPQFQTTFVKALSDPSRQVRVEAISAMSLLMPLATRIDPLIKELVSGALGKTMTAEGVAAAAVQTATLDALATVLDKGGAKAKLPESLASALDCSKELILSPDIGIRDSAAKAMGACCSLLGTEQTLQILKSDVIPHTSSETPEIRHGGFCAIRRILSAEIGSKLDDSTVIELKKLTVSCLNDDKELVKQSVFAALGATIGRGQDVKASFRKSEPDIFKILNNSRESIDVHRAMARGLCVALMMIEPEKRIDTMGLSLLDGSLQMALNSSARVQLAFNDVLWIALDVPSGKTGLDKYCSIANYDKQRSMTSLHSKVLVRIKEVSILES